MKNALLSLSVSLAVVGAGSMAALLHNTFTTKSFTAQQVSGLALLSLFAPAAGVLPLAYVSKEMA